MYVYICQLHRCKTFPLENAVKVLPHTHTHTHTHTEREREREREKERKRENAKTHRDSYERNSAEASSKYPARKGISFHPLHIKGLIVSCWRPLNGQTFRPGCQVRMWILHTKIQDGVQNGRQKDEFSNFSHIGVKDLHKYTYFCVVLLRSNLKSIIRL